ncbi:MAG: glucose 1-dehydrogenase [Rubrivivax sp.]|jgi:NAD(P)-dependent dehydrogenase (short-subunit alcohol dehydrogenase family)|nr:glucose 1-dehydrogenase [Rubrivivax sp.]
MPRLHDKVSLVTGAARGIGAAIARAFAAEGARVIVSDLDEVAGRATADAIGAAWIPLDVRDERAWIDAMARILDTHGRLDVLVNNAGITGLERGAPHDPEHASLEQWQAVHRTNLDGVFLGCKHALRTMRRRPAGLPGAIVNISSRSGMVGVPAAAAYASSKAAVRNHTKSVALYCAEQGLAIRCNSIHPAAVLTPMWEPMLGEEPGRAERMAAFVADTPLRRFGTPEEVAAVAVWLASDESAYITGAEFHVDGGLLAGSAAAPRDTDPR